MQASLPKLVIDTVVPYSFRAEKGLCPVCKRDFGNHQPEDLFLVGEHIHYVREYFASLDARQGENRGISPSFSEEPPESVMNERETVNAIKDLWLQKGPDEANQFQHLLAYATREYGSKWEWGLLSIALEQYRIHFDNTVDTFQYRLQEIARLNNLDLETEVGKEAAMRIFHEEIGYVAKNAYDDFAGQLHALESRIARNERMRISVGEGSANPEKREMMGLYKDKKKEASQARARPMEREIPNKS